MVGFFGGDGSRSGGTPTAGQRRRHVQMCQLFIPSLVATAIGYRRVMMMCLFVVRFFVVRAYLEQAGTQHKLVVAERRIGGGYAEQ